MRYFENKFPDYQPGSSIEIDKASWSAQITQLCESIMQGMPPAPENCDGGLYVGNAGIAYMFYWLSRNESLQGQRSTFLENAMLYARVSQDYLKHDRSQDRASFILGESGVHAVASLIFEACGSAKDANKYGEKYAAIAKDVMPINFLRCGSDELFVGRSGYLCGAMNLHKNLNRKVVGDDVLKQIIDAMIQSGQAYVARKRQSYPLMYAYYNTEYLGAAHGLSSILQMLLSFPACLKSNTEWENVVKKSVDFMLTLEQSSFNYPPAMDEVSHGRPESEELVHWCHGAAGVVYLFARAYKVWGEDRYLQACVRCAELTWHKGLLRKGPGICHGVAGSGYVFLLLYRLTGDQKYLYRALKFAEFLFSSEFQQARIPDSPYSLYEGWAGAVCFMADLLQPQQAEFPLFNVFLE